MHVGAHRLLLCGASAGVHSSAFCVIFRSTLPVVLHHALLLLPGLALLTVYGDTLLIINSLALLLVHSLLHCPLNRTTFLLGGDLALLLGDILKVGLLNILTLCGGSLHADLLR